MLTSVAPLEHGGHFFQKDSLQNVHPSGNPLREVLLLFSDARENHTESKTGRKGFVQHLQLGKRESGSEQHAIPNPVRTIGNMQALSKLGEKVY